MDFEQGACSECGAAKSCGAVIIRMGGRALCSKCANREDVDRYFKTKAEPKPSLFEKDDLDTLAEMLGIKI